MPLTRQQKERTVETMQEHIAGATSVAFIAYDALNIEEGNELRDKLYEQGCSMQVIPKRLLRLVMQQAEYEFNPTEHEGQIAVVWGDDLIAPAKTLYEFAKDKEHIRLLAGVLENQTLSMEEVTSLAKLPSRQELLGQLVGVLSGPMRGMASVLSGVPRNMVYVLEAIKEEKE